MNKLTICLIACCILSLSACSQIPKECEESWDKLEALSKQMGLNEEQIKEQTKQFEDSIKKQSKEQAIQMCQTQSTFLGLVGK